MPKMKWEISARELEDTEVSEFEAYDGELLPTPGLYPLDVRWIKATMSSRDNPMLKVLMVFNNPDDDEELADYVGCPVWDQIPVMDTTLFRVKPFLDAIGASYKEFVSSTIIDEEENVTKIGTVKIDGLTVRARLKVEVDDSGTYDDKLRPTKYLAAEEAPARPKKARKPVEVEPDEDDADDDDEPPARPKKKAAKKASTKKARKPVEPEDDADEDDDEAPF